MEQLVSSVAVLLPCGRFFTDNLDRRKSTACAALPSHRTQLVLGYIQPTTVLGRVAKTPKRLISDLAFAGSNAS